MSRGSASVTGVPAHLAALLMGAACAATLGGCGMSQKLATAKHSRCRPSETEITNLEREGNRETWTGTCPTATVECTAVGYDREVEYRCVETRTTPAPP